MNPRRRAGTLLLGALLLAAPRAGRAEALSPEQRAFLGEYLEVVAVAHERYGREVSYRDLAFASIQAMLWDLDPHTSFLTPKAYEHMRLRQRRSFYGVGILVTRRNDRITVISPLEGTPAFRLGTARPEQEE